MAAPALAAAIALSAICFGLRGTCGLWSCDPPDPVTAQVMKTSRFISSGIPDPHLPTGDTSLPISVAYQTRAAAWNNAESAWSREAGAGDAIRSRRLSWPSSAGSGKQHPRTRSHHCPGPTRRIAARTLPVQTARRRARRWSDRAKGMSIHAGSDRTEAPLEHAAQHPDPHGRPAQRNPVPRRARRLAARSEPEASRRPFGTVRQQLHRQPALRARARQLHVGAAAASDAGLRQRGRVRLRHPDLRASPAPGGIRTPACRARCISSGPIRCTASRSV